MNLLQRATMRELIEEIESRTTGFVIAYCIKDPDLRGAESVSTYYGDCLVSSGGLINILTLRHEARLQRSGIIDDAPDEPVTEGDDE